MPLDRLWLGNAPMTWLTAIGIAIGVALVLVTIRRVVVNRVRRFSERTANEWDDLLADVLAATRGWTISAIGMLAGSTALELDGPARALLRQLVLVVVLIQGGFWLGAAARTMLMRYRRDKLEDDPGAATMVGVIGFLVQVVVWAGVLLLALDNFGVDITALVAGLGVGGIAVALALQNVLGDIFASLAIVLDKPFVIGDFVVVDDLVGTVEYIGLKTTRVRALGGEQLVFSNADLLASRVRNFGRMDERRIVFTLGVTYQTPRALLEEIPAIIRAAVEAQPHTRCDRSHLSGYGASSIDFETAWYVLVPDFGTYMDVQQAIYLDIHRAFEDRGIEFAYPTQTLFLERS
jgi:small-conductance mechanosensitive channel